MTTLNGVSIQDMTSERLYGLLEGTVPERVEKAIKREFRQRGVRLTDRQRREFLIALGGGK